MLTGHSFNDELSMTLFSLANTNIHSIESAAREFGIEDKVTNACQLATTIDSINSQFHKKLKDAPKFFLRFDAFIKKIIWSYA